MPAALVPGFHSRAPRSSAAQSTELGVAQICHDLAPFGWFSIFWWWLTQIHAVISFSILISEPHGWTNRVRVSWSVPDRLRIIGSGLCRSFIEPCASGLAVGSRAARILAAKGLEPGVPLDSSLASKAVRMWQRIDL